MRKEKLICVSLLHDIYRTHKLLSRQELLEHLTVLEEDIAPVTLYLGCSNTTSRIKQHKSIRAQERKDHNDQHLSSPEKNICIPICMCVREREAAARVLFQMYTIHQDMLVSPSVLDAYSPSGLTPSVFDVHKDLLLQF